MKQRPGIRLRIFLAMMAVVIGLLVLTHGVMDGLVELLSGRCKQEYERVRAPQRIARFQSMQPLQHVRRRDESDFVARTDEFNNLVKDVAMHIAAASPRWVRREEVPAAEVEKEKAIYRAQMEKEGKPANVLEKIVEGKLGNFYSQFVLLDQPYIRDDKMTVSQLVAQASAKTGENIQVSRFVRFRVGESAE